MKAISRIFILVLMGLHSFCEASNTPPPDNPNPITLTAASPALADVSASLSIAKTGDTVIVPEGSAAWNEPLIITKGIKLVGAGIGKTVITSNYAARSSDSFSQTNFIISYFPSTPSANESFRLSGFTFDMAGKCMGLLLKNRTTTPINKIRIDHTEWKNVSGVAFHIYGTVYGVADNNIWPSGTMRFDGLDATTWNYLTFNFGTADNFYLEDNSITCNSDDYFYLEMGGRACFRYNTIDASIKTNGYYPLFELHGDAPYAHHSVMGAEIYGNTVNGGSRNIQFVSDRGGKALVYDNNVNTTGGVLLKVWEEFNDAQTPPAKNPAGQPQHVSDSYYWNNSKNGTVILNNSTFPYTGSQINYGGDEGLVPRENVHYWRHLSVFDGTSGMGMGLYSSRPGNCTTGVGYWATDQNTLYRATATNTWVAYYTPYAYPHPLRALLQD